MVDGARRLDEFLGPSNRLIILDQTTEEACLYCDGDGCRRGHLGRRPTETRCASWPTRLRTSRMPPVVGGCPIARRCRLLALRSSGHGQFVPRPASPRVASCSSANWRIVSSIEYRVRPDERSATSSDLRTNASSRSSTANSSIRNPLQRRHFRDQIHRRTPNSSPAVPSPRRQAGRTTTALRGAAFGDVPVRGVTRPAAGTADRDGHAPRPRSSTPSAMPPARRPTGCRRDDRRFPRPRRLVGRKALRDTASTLDEQVDGRIDVQRSHPPHLLIGDPESFTAGGQDLHRRRLAENGFDQIRRGIEDVLAVVEHQTAALCPRARRPPTPSRSCPAVA